MLRGQSTTGVSYRENINRAGKHTSTEPQFEMFIIYPDIREFDLINLIDKLTEQITTETLNAPPTHADNILNYSENTSGTSSHLNPYSGKDGICEGIREYVMGNPLLPLVLLSIRG